MFLQLNNNNHKRNVKIALFHCTEKKNKCCWSSLPVAYCSLPAPLQCPPRGHRQPDHRDEHPRGARAGTVLPPSSFLLSRHSARREGGGGGGRPCTPTEEGDAGKTRRRCLAAPLLRTGWEEQSEKHSQKLDYSSRVGERRVGCTCFHGLKCLQRQGRGRREERRTTHAVLRADAARSTSRDGGRKPPPSSTAGKVRATCASGDLLVATPLALGILLPRKGLKLKNEDVRA